MTSSGTERTLNCCRAMERREATTFLACVQTCTRARKCGNWTTSFSGARRTVPEQFNLWGLRSSPSCAEYFVWRLMVSLIWAIVCLVGRQTLLNLNFGRLIS